MEKQDKQNKQDKQIKQIKQIKQDINLQIIKNQKSIDNLENNFIIINFKGKNINYIIMSTIRRTLLRQIPIYAFSSQFIDIQKNTSIFNNDMIKLRFNNLPIILSNIESYNLNPIDNINKINNLLLNKFDGNDVNSIQMFLNVQNNSNSLQYITTNDCQFKLYNGTIIQNTDLFKRPILLIILKQNQELLLSCKSILNIAENDCKWAAVKSPCGYIEQSENSFDLKIESRRQLNELECLKRSCLIIINNLNKLKKELTVNINTIKKNKDKNFKLISGQILLNEDHTFGNLITKYLQEHDDIITAGYNINSFLIKEININFESKIDIQIIVNDIFDDMINIFNHIIIQINNL